MTNNVTHFCITFADIAVENPGILKRAWFAPIQILFLILLSAQFDEFCPLLVLWPQYYKGEYKL
jgi:hypothetical protein